VEFLDLGLADFASYLITDTLPGPWQMVLTADADARAACDYVAYASLDAPLRLTVTTDRAWYRVGQALTITASLDAPTGTLTITESACVAYLPGGEDVAFPAQPIAASEGDRQWRLRLPDQAGYTVLSVTLSGTYAGRPFVRGEFAIVGVSDARACLRPAHRLMPATGGGLRAEIGVTVRQAGDYLLSINLQDERGRAARVAHPVYLEPGEQTVAVPVAARALPGSVELTAWRLGEISLLDISGAALPLDAGFGESAGDGACP
jgi:hypothetical protein